MRTKIIIREKTLYEQIKELFPRKQFGSLYVDIRPDQLTITFEFELNDGQIQKIKNLLEKKHNLVIEEIE